MSKKKSPSQSQLILWGAALGLACGLFFGEYCRPLLLVGDAYVKLLQVMRTELSEYYVPTWENKPTARQMVETWAQRLRQVIDEAQAKWAPIRIERWVSRWARPTGSVLQGETAVLQT